MTKECRDKIVLAAQELAADWSDKGVRTMPGSPARRLVNAVRGQCQAEPKEVTP